MENLLEHLYKLFTITIGPILALLGYQWKRQVNRMDVLERRMNQIEKENAVQESKISDIYATVQELKSDFKEDSKEKTKKLDMILQEMRRRG